MGRRNLSSHDYRPLFRYPKFGVSASDGCHCHNEDDGVPHQNICGISPFRYRLVETLTGM